MKWRSTFLLLVLYCPFPIAAANDLTCSDLSFYLDHTLDTAAVVNLENVYGIDALAWSSDGTQLAIMVNRDGWTERIQVWHVVDGQFTTELSSQYEPGGTLVAHYYDTADGATMVWSPDGTRITSLSNDGLHLWDDQQGWAEMLFQVDISNNEVVWSLDATRLAVTEGIRTEVWDALEGRTVYRYVDASFGSRVVVDGDRWLVFAQQEERLTLRDLDTEEPLFDFGDRYLVDVVWQDDVQRVVTIQLGDDAPDVVEVWNMPTQSVILTLRDDFYARSRLSPDGKWLLAHLKTGWQVWNLADQTITVERRADQPDLRTAVWSADSRCLVTFSSPDATFSVETVMWDVATGERLLLPGSEREALVSVISWSLDGTRLAVARTDGVVEIWGVEVR